MDDKKELKRLYRELNKVEEKLEAKQVKFCEEYLNNGFNGTLATKSAGYNCSTDASYASQASRLLKYDNVDKYLSISKQINLLRYNVDPDTIRDDMLQQLVHLLYIEELPVGKKLDVMKMLAQITGISVNKSEVTHKGEMSILNDRLSEMTKEDIELELQKLR